MTNPINKSYLLACSFSLLLGSCCYTSDSRVPSGYPFSGNSQELNFTLYTAPSNYSSYNPNYYSQYGFLDSTYIRDTIACNDIFRQVDSSYNCNIDFNKYSLAYLGGYVEQVYSAEFQKRVLIDHHDRTYIIEIRAFTKTCNSGLNSSYNNYYIHEFILIPKVPDGYLFRIARYGVM